MSKKTSKKKDNEQSFWTTLPGILTAIAAVITAIGGLAAALNVAGLSGNRQPPSIVVSPTPQVVTTTSAQTSISTSPSTVATVSADCFVQYFQGMAKDRLASLESGAQDFQLIGSDQTKEEPIGIKFTENNQPIGGIRFRFFSNNQLFKVETVVDSKCQKTEDYSNKTGEGDKNVLQNFASLQLRLGNFDYQLQLLYDGSITANFRKFSP